MGNYRFRLSDMIPNAWLYKLKDMSKTGRSASSIPKPKKKTHQSTSPKSILPKPPLPPLKPGRASYYIPSSEDKFPNSPVNPRASDTKYLIDPPRKSKKKHRGRSNITIRPSTKVVTSSISSGCSCRSTLDSVWEADYPLVPEIPEEYDDDDVSDDFNGLHFSDKPVISATLSRSCNKCRVTSPATDIIIDVDGRKRPLSQEPEKILDELDLPPIVTKPAKKNSDPCTRSEPGNSYHGRRLSSSAAIQGLRMRANSPRVLASKKMQSHRSKKSGTVMTPRKGLSGSFAVVKSSSNPMRDFRDSMVEMIMENNIRAAKDLEDLLACYLSLNSNEYHDVIVKVFEQIWFDLTNIKL